MSTKCVLFGVLVSFALGTPLFSHPRPICTTNGTSGVSEIQCKGDLNFNGN